jgi:hypothetical protein
MINNDSFTRIKNDINGNPRYVIHFLDLNNDYENALKTARKLGGRKFHNKQYGGGIVFQSYNNHALANQLNQLIGAK